MSTRWTSSIPIATRTIGRRISAFISLSLCKSAFPHTLFKHPNPKNSRFQKELPNQCELLRSKVFPHESIPDSPDSDPPQPMKRSLSRALSRGPSLPPPRARSREPSVPPAPGKGGFAREKSSGDLFGVSRARSRSRSIVEDSKPNIKVQGRTGVGSVNPYEVTFRRSLSKPALDLDGGKAAKANPG